MHGRRRSELGEIRSGGIGLHGIGLLCLVQVGLGALTVFATSTLNRIFVVELGWPATLSAGLVALHYGVQLLRPGFGYRADRAGSAQRLIWAGMAGLAASDLVAAGAAMAGATGRPALALTLAVAGYGGIGLGVGCAGTAVLASLAAGVAPARRGLAASLAWFAMIGGGIVAAVLMARLLRPYSPAALGRAALMLAGLAMALTLAATAWLRLPALPKMPAHSLARALSTALRDATIRRFGGFVLLAMLGYAGQEILLEPFAARCFHLPPAGTAWLMGLEQSAVLAGMVLVAALGRRVAPERCAGTGSVLSALALLALAASGLAQRIAPAEGAMLALGLGLGLLAAGSLGGMMGLAADRPAGGIGARIGVFGAAQALGLGLGGLLAAGLVDGLRARTGPGLAYGGAFALEAVSFVLAARLAQGAIGRAGLSVAGQDRKRAAEGCA